VGARYWQPRHGRLGGHGRPSGQQERSPVSATGGNSADRRGRTERKSLGAA